MSFSERMGLGPPPKMLQLDEMDRDLRVSLWNVFYLIYGKRMLTLGTSAERAHFKTFSWRLWVNFFKYKYDATADDSATVLNLIHGWFFEEASWSQVYDFLEFVLRNYPEEPFDSTSTAYVALANVMLERENSGYRFLRGQIVPISTEAEVESVEEALTGAAESVGKHLATAMDHLRNRENPDYRNSIKESISAVEAACRLVTGNSKATLGDGLKALGKKSPDLVHTALLDGFNKLYGYTSDTKGIRHALLEGQADPSFAEAKFMLVACSAFVNLLTEVAAE